MSYLLVAVALAAQTPPTTTTEMSTSYRFMEMERSADGKSRALTWSSGLNGSIKPADLPAAVRSREGKGEVTIAIKVAADGSPGACSVDNGDAAIGKSVCSLLSIKGRMPLTYSAPQEPVAHDWLVSLIWTTRPSAGKALNQVSYDGLSPAPPSPPGWKSWPPRSGNRQLVLKSPPGAAALISVFERAKGKGVVGIEAVVRDNRATPRCDVKAPSGHPALDALACELVSDMRFAFAKPCSNCDYDMVQGVRVIFSKSNVDVKLAADHRRYFPMLASRPPISGKTSKMAAAELAERPLVTLRLMVGPDGRISSCNVTRPVSQQLATLICREASSAVYQPALDGFGDPMTGEAYLPLRFTP